jgi:hypothetical protein
MDYSAPFPEINSASRLSFRGRMGKKNAPAAWKNLTKAEAGLRKVSD